MLKGLINLKGKERKRGGKMYVIIALLTSKKETGSQIDTDTELDTDSEADQETKQPKEIIMTADSCYFEVIMKEEGEEGEEGRLFTFDYPGVCLPPSPLPSIILAHLEIENDIFYYRDYFMSNPEAYKEIENSLKFFSAGNISSYSFLNLLQPQRA